MEITESYQRFSEPAEGDKAGHTATFESPKAPYDLFMEAEGLPIYRAIGHHDVRELELADWPRMGARGAFLQLLGTEGLWGMYVLEIPPGGATTAEQHIYEETFYVVEGHGTTEVWSSSGAKPARFEWQAGSLFSIPLNAHHRIINATRERVVMIVGTTAPSILDTFPEDDFIFHNPYEFAGAAALEGGDAYFDYSDELFVDPHRGRAMQISNFIPDVVRCELPLDNQRSPGYRRIEARMGSGRFSYSSANMRSAGIRRLTSTGPEQS
jgi:quercetin dioxygenase-like cupin family protein